MSRSLNTTLLFWLTETERHSRKLWMSLIGLIGISICSCTPESITREWPMVLDVYQCLEDQVCVESLFTRTQLGCYVTREANERALVRRNRFRIDAVGELIFEDDRIPQSPGDRFVGSLFFLERGSDCGRMTPEMACGDGCLLRLSHDEVTVGLEPTQIDFNSSGTCDILSEDDEMIRLCLDNEIGQDMGDMGGMEDMRDMDLSACTPERLGMPCDAEDTSALGACATGVYRCQDDQLICEPNGPIQEGCDLIDNDCDGAVDETEIQEPCANGVGACEVQGSFACVGGLSQCVTPPTPEPASSDATCDAVDDDCDGRSDEDYVITEVSCGIGVCQRSGIRLCQAGELIDDCVPEPPEVDRDERCDLLDEDCDGQVDEDYEVSVITCGIGACVANGERVCADGAVVEQCSPTAPAESDPICDGVDDDCDSRIDEDYTITATVCGVGSCQAVGALECIAGVEIDSCSPTLPEVDVDSTCDGVDDDCDGSVDEEYVPTQITCGVGACQSEGLQLCQAGTLVDECTPSDPARADDPTCDGVDDDCDGESDEDFNTFAGDPCGQGVCEQVGTFICQEGQLVNACTPLEPTTDLDAADAVCDAIDDDCDGSIDEDFPIEATSCGIGVCAAVGELTCRDGAVIDTCDPTTLVGEVIDDCDSLDNDCDGAADEDFTSQTILCDVETSCVKTGISSCLNGVPGDSCDQAAQRDSDGDGVGDPCAWVSHPQLTFAILRHEVTFGAYRDCVAQGGCQDDPLNYQVSNDNDDDGCQFLSGETLSAEPADKPLRCVVTEQLAEYCDWIGGRLPTPDELLDQVLPTFGDFTCADSISGGCPNTTGRSERVCSLEVTPGDLEICDLGGNVYELTSEVTQINNTDYMSVCFDDYDTGEAFLNRCATQKKSETNPRIGGRCVRD